MISSLERMPQALPDTLSAGRHAVPEATERSLR
jgi:hypothetical protein